MQKPIITTEVGQHQMWAAQHFGFEGPNKWLTSGGLGPMGYGLPAAIGAQIGNPNALVIDIAGEASLLMNIKEMSTVVQYRLPTSEERRVGNAGVSTRRSRWSPSRSSQPLISDYTPNK